MFRVKLNVPFLLALVMLCADITQAAERISVQKCNEYRQVIVSKRKATHLLINATPREIEVFNCTRGRHLIVGGERAMYGEFPHHAILGYPKIHDPSDYNFLCGGTLISEQHVLTAAHCFMKSYPTVVRLGEYDTSAPSDGELQIEIDCFRLHPNFLLNKPYYDIALIRLKQRVEFSKHIRPACLWDSLERFSTQPIASGYGQMSSTNRTQPITLMKVQLEEFSREYCNTHLTWLTHKLRPGQLCVGSIGSGKDTCWGDSGGPLQQLTNATTCTYHVIGVTSFGQPCGEEVSIGIYTEVAHYVDWIEDNVWGANAL